MGRFSGAAEAALKRVGDGDEPKLRLSRTVAKAEATGDKSLFARARKIAGRTGHDVLTPVGQFLQVIDLPRSAVVSTAEETGRALRGDGFSIDNLIKHTKAHRGVGQVITEENPKFANGLDRLAGKGLELATLGSWEAPEQGSPWGRRIAGGVGDLAADPLNLIDGFGAVAKPFKAGEGVVEGAEVASKFQHIGFEDVIRRLRDESTLSRFGKEAVEDAAENVAKRRSAAALPREMREAIGVEVGASMPTLRNGRQLVPGTERLSEVVAGRIGSGRRGLTDAVRRRAGRDAKWADALAKFDTHEGVNALRASKELERPHLAAADMVEAKRAVEHAGNSFRHDAAKELAAVEKAAQVRGLDRDLLRKAIENPETLTVAEAASKEAVAAKAYREWFESVRQRASDAVGRDLPKLDEFLPHRLTAEQRALLDRTGRVAKGADPFTKRTILDSIDNIHAAGVEKYGDLYRPLFETDPVLLARKYLQEMERFVKKEAGPQALVGAGLAKQAPPELAGLVKQLGKESSVATNSGKAAARAEQRLMEASEALEGAAGLPGAAEATQRRLTHLAATLDVQADKAAEALSAAREARGVTATELRVAQREAELAAKRVGGTEAEIRLARKELRNAKNAAGRAEVAASATWVRVQETVPVAHWSNPEAFIGDKPVLSHLGLSAADKKVLDRLFFAHKRVVEASTNLDSMLSSLKDLGFAEAANKARLGQLEKELADAKGLVASRRAAEVELRRQARDMWAAAEKAPGEAAKQVARLEAQAAQAAADFERKSLRAVTARQLADDTKAQVLVGEEWNRGFRELTIGTGLWSEPDIAIAAERLFAVTQPKEMNLILRTYDTLSSRWRAYALLSPGYHARNWMGGIFNNALAGVDYGMYGKWEKAWRELRRGDFELSAVKNREMRDTIGLAQRHGVFADHGVRDLSDVGIEQANSHGLVNAGRRVAGRDASDLADKLDPTSLNFKPLAMNFKAAERVESHLRGVMFADAILNKGKTPEEALGLIRKYHFDYSELSAFERSTMKRIAAFYTWNRKNLPLQIEMMIRRPGFYNKYQTARRNIEIGTPEETTVPAYYGELLAIHTPWTMNTNGPAYMMRGEKGANLYATPDLPFTSLTDVSSLSGIGAQLNPLLKTPFELRAKKQFFGDMPLRDTLEPMPTAWTPFAPVLQALGGKFGIPRAIHTKNGWMMSNMDAYKIEQASPTLGRLRRLAPSEERLQKRAFSSWLSFFVGASIRSNDTSAQAGEIMRRNNAIKSAVDKYYLDHPDVERPDDRAAAVSPILSRFGITP